MNIRLARLVVRTRQSTEEIRFSDTVTFLYGPVGTGKSTVARLIDYCLGAELERTPAIQLEFVSAELSAQIGEYECTIERGAEDTRTVRVSWMRGHEDVGSVNAPVSAGQIPLVDADVYSLSDLLFHLCGVVPIKVPKRRRDPDSPTIRLGFRDIWRYCYLDQAHLDSSFFRLEDPFRGRKSQDAMRFFTGLHSDRLSQLQTDLYRAIAEQDGAREAVTQIRQFMAQFDLGSEVDLAAQIEEIRRETREALRRKQDLEKDRSASTHPADDLRQRLRDLSREVSDLKEAVIESQCAVNEQEALRAELAAAKVKARRVEHAGRILDGVDYVRCPQCGSDLSKRPLGAERCRLCCMPAEVDAAHHSIDIEAVRRELNDRIDQLADSIRRKRRAIERSERELGLVEGRKRQLDLQLQDELERYDSAFVESVRVVDREIATLEERSRSLARLQGMPRAISDLEEQAGALQGRIEQLRSSIDGERKRLGVADRNAREIAETFKSIMLKVGFPGVSEQDEVVLDPRGWKPVVVHSDQEWGFWDTGSGGKKTLFNVCYALAVHEVARRRSMPVPSVLIIDSPTKNISDDENPELVRALYREVYNLADSDSGIQFLLIDSDIVEPEERLDGFSQRRMAGEPGAPSLISYYVGP